MWRLFDGRRDAFGAVHGEAVRRPLQHRDWTRHLFEDGSIGIYPLCPALSTETGLDVFQEMHGPAADVDEWVCRWGCVDIDDGYEASLPIARNLQKAYSVLGLSSWIERTKGKGFHVWIFFSDWVPAVQARAVQLLACHLIDYHPREINPKQTKLADGQLGNYVNLPYAKRWVPKRMMINPDSPDSERSYVPLIPFIAEAEATLNTPEKIAEVAALYKEPRPAAAVRINKDAYVDTPRLSPLARKVAEEGPLPHPETGHIDRSAGLQKLAHLCAKDGLNPGETFQVVYQADIRWGKYSCRRDGEQQLERIVENAYQ